VPIHYRIFEVKTLQITHSSCLNFLWKSEKATELCDLGYVEFDQQVFFVRGQKGYIRGGSWLSVSKRYIRVMIRGGYLISLEGISDDSDCRLVQRIADVSELFC